MIPLDPAIQWYREKARRDHATLLYAAVQEGEARGRVLGEAHGRALGEAHGRALGEAQSRVEIARNMKKRGRPEVRPCQFG